MVGSAHSQAVQKLSDFKYKIGAKSVEGQTKITGTHNIEGKGKERKWGPSAMARSKVLCLKFYLGPGGLYQIM